MLQACFHYWNKRTAMTLPKLPPDAVADLNLCKAQSRRAYIKTHENHNYSCPNCGDIGLIFLQYEKAGPFKTPLARDVCAWHDDAWYKVETRSYPCPVCQNRSQLIAYLWERCGLEPHECEWKLDYYQNLPGKESAQQACRDILTTLPRLSGWLVLYGDYGVGKSGMLKSTIAACVRAGQSAHYTRAEDVLQQIRSTYGESASEMDVIRAYGSYPLLAIDEIDRTSSTEWARSTLMTILDTRYNRRGSQATLMGTNTQPERFPPALGYLASRMRDGVRVHVGGSDLRGT